MREFLRTITFITTQIIVNNISNPICPDERLETSSKIALKTMRQTEINDSIIILISISWVIISDKRQKSRKNEFFSHTIAYMQNTMQIPITDTSARG